MRLDVAGQVAEALLAELGSVPGVKRAVAAGSLRRRRDTVGDLDLLVATSRGAAVMDRFTGAPDVRSVLAKGGTRSTIVLRDGLQVDLRAVPPASFGAAWMYFTGSKAHNIALRRIAQDKGLKLNEYGLFRGAERVAGRTEEEVYLALGFPWIPPELREDRGEIAAARRRALPPLVERSHLRGDLHVHTRETDGRDTLEAMAAAAVAQGLEYIAITDHSARIALVHGLDAGRLARQVDAIDEFNAKQGRIHVLKGIEVDILEDGRLDLPLDVLRRLDLVVGAIHHRFDLPRPAQTARILRAMDQPCFSILAHPTGRLLGERAAYDVDMPRIVRHARERGCFLELNAHPARLDIDDVACRMAKDEGVLVSIATDAHSRAEFANLEFGIGQARRGWLGPNDVLNARPLAGLMPLLARTMGRAAARAERQLEPTP
jgi:DNA polymerase (family 10)